MLRQKGEHIMSSEHFSQSVSGAEGGCHSGSPLSVDDRSQTIIIGILIHHISPTSPKDLPL